MSLAPTANLVCSSHHHPRNCPDEETRLRLINYYYRISSGGGTSRRIQTTSFAQAKRAQWGQHCPTKVEPLHEASCSWRNPLAPARRCLLGPFSQIRNLLRQSVCQNATRGNDHAQELRCDQGTSAIRTNLRAELKTWKADPMPYFSFDHRRCLQKSRRHDPRRHRNRRASSIVF